MKLIGITCMKEMVYQNDSNTLYHNYTESVFDSKACAIIIPSTLNKQGLEALIDKLDGVIFSGGVDIDPSLYNQKNRCSEYVTVDRDENERLIFDYCVQKKKPVLGICRGHQFINVMCGGSLYQDNTEKGEVNEHKGGVKHIINITDNSFLHNVLGSECLVNSYHHQSVDKVGKGLKVTAVSEDGIVEALEHETLPIVSVQFHPEKDYDDPNMKKIFDEWIQGIEE